MSRPYAAESAFRAIADPTRRRIIELLLNGERTSMELLAELNVAQPTLSHHLGMLRGAGLVSQRRVGRSRAYQVHPGLLRPPAEWLRKCRA